jgi:hypothetical protein
LDDDGKRGAGAQVAALRTHARSRTER